MVLKSGRTAVRKEILIPLCEVGAREDRFGLGKRIHLLGTAGLANVEILDQEIAGLVQVDARRHELFLRSEVNNSE